MAESITWREADLGDAEVEVIIETRDADGAPTPESRQAQVDVAKMGEYTQKLRDAADAITAACDAMDEMMGVGGSSQDQGKQPAKDGAQPPPKDAAKK